MNIKITDLDRAFYVGKDKELRTWYISTSNTIGEFIKNNKTNIDCQINYLLNK